jgi:uncharacterized membrane protein
MTTSRSDPSVMVYLVVGLFGIAALAAGLVFVFAETRVGGWVLAASGGVLTALAVRAATVQLRRRRGSASS